MTPLYITPEEAADEYMRTARHPVVSILLDREDWVE